MTQIEFNRKIVSLIGIHVNHTMNTTTLDRIKDPYTIDLKTRERFLSNIISSLIGYDISTNILTEEQILYTFELGICAGQSSET